MERADRLIAAQAIPLEAVVDRLGLTGLRRAGGELVGGCPVCGDDGKRDADRFAINPLKGVWLCRRCEQHGDGIELVKFVQNCSFGAALDFLIGQADVALSPQERQRRADLQARQSAARAEAALRMRRAAIAQARAIWQRAWPHPTRGGAAPITPAEAYLAGRGITFESWPPSLRFLPDHPAVKSVGGQVRELHRGPCLIAAIQDAGGTITAVHQTWLNPDRPGTKATFCLPDGSAAPSKMVRGSKKGGAIRLSPAPGIGLMIMGEGIETTASIMAAGLAPGAAFWAGVDLGNMAGRQLPLAGVRHSGLPDLSDRAAFVPPPGITRLVFLQDGDSAPKATRAKLEAGIRRAMTSRAGLCGVIVPAEPGKDFNDMLQEGLKK